MGTKLNKPGEVFRIINRGTGEPQGFYSRAYREEYDFTSAEEARSADYHGVCKDEAKYQICKYRVSYKLVDEGVRARSCKGSKIPDRLAMVSWSLWLSTLEISEKRYIETTLEDYAKDIRTMNKPRSMRPDMLYKQEFTCKAYTAVAESKLGDVISLVCVE